VPKANLGVDLISENVPWSTGTSEFDLAEIAPAGFVNHSETVYVAPTERDFSS